MLRLEGKQDVPEIRIQLADYFSGQTVVVSTQGRELARAENVKTDMRQSRARMLTVQAPEGELVLTVAVPEARASAEVKIDTGTIRYVEARLDGDRLRLEAVSEEDYRREPRGAV
jgi:hypothetical protein